MENIIKLNAQQALFSANNRLVDLILPGNSGVYNLSETYVAITVSADGVVADYNTAATDGRLAPGGAYLQESTAVQDVRLALKHQSTGDSIYDSCAMPISTLVRNCSLFSSTKGKIEDIRRSDTLRGTMAAYTDDVSDVVDRSIGGFAPMAKSNPWASGRFAQMVGVGDTTTKTKTHELRINLKDIFNFGEVESYDSQIYGALHVHLELNLNRLILTDGLSVDAGLWDRYYHNNSVGTPSYPANVKYSHALTLTKAVGAAAFSDDSIEMGAEYCSLEDSPFYTNQLLKVTTNYAGGSGTAAGQYPADASEKWAVVKSIAWDKVTKRITLGFGTGTGVLSTTGVVTTNPITIDRIVEGITSTIASLESALVVQSVELTAVRRPDMVEGPSTTQYTQFLTQSDQWQNSSTLNRSYYLPPQTTNAYIMLPSASGDAFSDILGCARLGDYRFTINGESVTNRAVPYMPIPGPFPGTAVNDAKTLAGSSLHYTLIAETLMNAGVRYSSLNEAVFDQLIPYSTPIPDDGAGVSGWKELADCPTKACYMIALPVPISNEQTQLTVELNGNFPASSGELHLFSEIRSVV